MKHLIVASTNPVKLQAVMSGFADMFPSEEFEVQGCVVDSGVSAQPMSDAETIQGARQRVTAAKQQFPEADFWVGLEGGVETIGADMFSCAWVVIEDKNLTGQAKTAAFKLPIKIANLIHGGMELGDADDVTFGKSNSKQHNGSVGILTHDVITRTTLYAPAVILALIPWKQPQLYA